MKTLDGGVRACVCVVCIGALWPEATVGQEREFNRQYGLSASYITGDYGEEGDTDLWYVPASVKGYWDIGDITVTVPYVRIASDSGAVVIDGNVDPAEGGDSYDNSGLGDVILRGRYYLVEQKGYIPFIDAVGKIKVPTADEDKNLGTGEADYSLISEFSQRINREYLWLAELGYTWIGDPPDVDYDNRVEYSLGLGKTINESWQTIVYLDGRTAIVDGNDDPLSLMLSGEYRRRDDLRFDGTLELGLNDGAPDFGITLGVRLKRW